MTELNIDLHSLPDHCVQFILDLLSFRVLQSLASNGTSPFQTKILRSIYKVVDIGYGYNRKLDLEYLKSHELFGSRNEISAQLKSCQAFQQLLDSNRQIRVQEVRIMSVPAPRFIPNLHELDSVERIFVNLANLDNFRKGERNALRYLPDNVYMVVTDYYPEMLFPQNLRKLELSLWDAMTVENLPPRLQFLSIAQRSGEPSMSLQQLGRLPQTLKHLILLNCIDMSHEDGECKLDLPLSLCALKISTGYSGNACLDISHLKNLQRFSVYLPVLPLSFFKLPPSILKLCYESERGLSCSEQISKLSLLNNVQLQLGNVTSKIRFSNSVNNVCLKSGRFGSKPVGDCIELPEQLKFLEFQNCSGLRLTSNHAYMTSLTIFSCKVISLPVIDSLKTLKIINLRNQIKFWDTIDKYFPELLWLEVENSQLESVPSIPCQLETLILDHNLIQEFHLRVPPSLTSISMVSNILKTFIVSGPSNLKKIDIQMNRFSELSHSRLQLPSSLCELDMSACKIFSVSEGFTFPDNICVLSLRNNSILNLDSILSKLPLRIVYLDVSTQFRIFNPRKNEKRTTVKSKTLWNVDLDGALLGLSINWADCPNLQYISMSENYLGDIDLKDFPSSLKGIKLSYTTINKLEGDFENLTNLIEVDLTNCEGHLGKDIENNTKKFGPMVLVSPTR